MKNKIIAIVAVILAVGAYFFFTADSSEEQVKKRLEEFRVAALKPIGLVGLNRLSTVKGLENYFMEDIKITVRNGQYVLQGRSDLSRLAQAGYTRATPVEASLSDVTVEMQSDDLALVYLTVVIKGGNFGDRWNQAQELKLSLKHFDGDWRFATAETIEALTLD